MSEKYMIIDGIRTAFTDEKNILQVIRKAGIHVPTFCYYTDMSIYNLLIVHGGAAQYIAYALPVLLVTAGRLSVFRLSRKQ